jgi:hypothetical protein
MLFLIYCRTFSWLIIYKKWVLISILKQGRGLGWRFTETQHIRTLEKLEKSWASFLNPAHGPVYAHRARIAYKVAGRLIS